MNFRMRTLLKVSGLMLIITGLAMFPSFFCARHFNEPWCELGFGLTGLTSVLIGSLLFFLIDPSKKGLHIRDGYLAVIMCWLLCSLFGAIPYLISGEVPSVTDAFFESVAGYTTTGSTVFSNHITNSLSLWKVTCHWLGGMGILVFVISILPAFGIGGQRIANAETPGAGLAKMAPRMQDLAKILYVIYIALTLLEFLFLWIGSEMNPYEAIVNAMGGISTAGLFLHPEGIGYYDSLYVEIVLSVFTILGSLNFMVYINLMKKNYNQLVKNIEIRVYLILIVVITLIVSLSLKFSGTYETFGKSLRYGFFQVTSFASTSGFNTADYTTWPAICKMLLFTMLFIGGCAASTSGSVKVIRIIIMFKLIGRGFFKRIHPRSVKAIKIGENTISAHIVSSVTTFIILYGVTFVLSAVVLSLQGLSLETTLSATASLMSTTGISFGDVGANGYYGMFCPALKVFMSFVMILGRLELFTVFITFFPSFWNPDRSQIR